MEIEKAIQIITGVEQTMGNANILKEPLQMALAALQENQRLERALEIACAEMADHQCPYDFNLECWPECDTCPKGNEERYDADRDIACWKRWAVEKAEKALVDGSHRNQRGE